MGSSRGVKVGCPGWGSRSGEGSKFGGQGCGQGQGSRSWGQGQGHDRWLQGRGSRSGYRSWVKSVRGGVKVWVQVGGQGLDRGQGFGGHGRGQGCGQGRGSRSLDQGQGHDRWSQGRGSRLGSMSGVKVRGVVKVRGRGQGLADWGQMVGGGGWR